MVTKWAQQIWITSAKVLANRNELVTSGFPVGKPERLTMSTTWDTWRLAGKLDLPYQVVSSVFSKLEDLHIVGSMSFGYKNRRKSYYFMK